MDNLDLFKKDYCPPLDPALVSAILSDFDIHEDPTCHAARQTLDALKENAVEQEATGFDASGTSAQDGATSEVGSQERATSCPESRQPPSSETDLTSLGNSVQSLQIRDPSEATDSDQGATTSRCLAELESEDEGAKTALLKEMFPRAKDFAIVHTLKKCDGRLDRAMDELLNQAFFIESEESNGNEKIIAKSVDAFSENNARRRGRKKAANKRFKSLDMQDEKRASSLPASQKPVENSWTRGRNYIEFISSRTNAPYNAVSALFHQNGASLPSTILALLGAKKVDQDKDDVPYQQNPIVVANAAELRNDFPSIPPSQCMALIELTYPSTASAHELARILDEDSKSLANRGTSGGIEVVTRHVPLFEDTQTLPGPPTLVDRSSTSQWTSVIRNGTTTGNGQQSSDDSTAIDPATLATAYSLAQSRAQAQASAAARRGRSDRLMMSAAGYYSQVGRDYATKRVEATAEAADALVDAQSTRDMIDLHGVGVKDGVRIARAKVELWWKTRQRRTMGFDGRVRVENDGGVVSGLKIVTGVGKHSRGGQALLGPAIGRMLANDGWSASVDNGVWIVTGKRR